jgi:AAA domain
MRPNPQTLSCFLAAFYPDEQEPIHLRAFGPKKAPKNEMHFSARKVAASRNSLATDTTLLDQLCELNSTRGLYFVVNAGGDTDEEITRFNAWFAEDDARPIDEQYRMLDTAPLPPSIRVETRQSVHAYWLIKGGCAAEEWREIQQRLIFNFGGDEKIKNPSRVMRLPFFNHIHYDQGRGELSFKQVKLISFAPERRYTVAEMQAAFAAVSESSPEPPVSGAQVGLGTFATWDELNAEVIQRIRQWPKAHTHGNGWTHAPGLCHGSAEGKAQFVSPDGAYGCHKGCSTAQVRASHGLPEYPDTIEPESGAANGQSKATRASRFTFTTLDDLLDEPEEETAYVWDKTLPRGGFSICAAKPKVGKSTLARNLAVAVSKGAEFFGRATVKGKIIYLCLEEKRAEVARHFRQMNTNGTEIIIHTGSAPSDALTALESAIEEFEPALIIIDPLSRFVRVTDFNSYGEVTRGLEPLIDLARTSECQCHIMAVHHNGKGEREGGDALLGSTGFFGAVDTLLTMKKRDRARTLETSQRYGENLPETVVHLDMETGLVTPQGDMQTLLLKERKEAVMDSFGDEPLTEGDIKERIGGNQGLTSKAVRALYEEGQLIRTGAGKKGDPYQYQKAGGTAQKPSENSRFSGFPIYTNLENLQNPASDLPDEIYIPPGMTDEEMERYLNGSSRILPGMAEFKASGL